MRKQICKLNFRQLPPVKLDTFAQLILIGIYQNPAIFTTPPVIEGDLVSLYNVFTAAYADYDKYKITKKTAYLQAKDNLINALNILAVYVDSVALGDVSIIALSGFEPSREVDEPAKPLEKINNFSAKRSENSGEIVVSIASIANHGRISYGCICVEDQPLNDLTMVNGQVKIQGGSPTVVYDNNKSRVKVLSGLTPGKTYFVYVFANNSVSVSPLSDYRQIMAA